MTFCDNDLETEKVDPWKADSAPGISLRDYFAGQAIAALISRHRADLPWEKVAPTAYVIADAMLRARDE